jgi:hypothetical protein
MGKIKPKYYVGDRGLFRKKAFETPEELWEAFCEYAQWIIDNPLFKHEAIKSGEGAGTIIDIPAGRPMTIMGFCLYVGIAHRNFINYGKEESYKEYHQVYDNIHNACYTQKFDGASIGKFNAMIIARDLGLSEKTETKHEGIPAIPPMLQVKVMDAADKQ